MSLNLDFNGVKVERSQVSTMIELLAQAFNSDPIIQYFYPVDSTLRLKCLRWLSRVTFRYASPYGQIYTTPSEPQGCAIWLPPNAYPINTWRLFRLGFYQFPLKVQLGKIVQFLKVFNQMEHYHEQDMPQPHWYLVMLGVAPAYQGQGVGSRLLHPVLQQADRDNLPCYLETSTERGVQFYQRHGFEVVRTESLANGPCYWTMQRHPRPQ